MKRRVVVLVGLPGSGKTTAAHFFHCHHVPVVRMGALTDYTMEREGMRPIEQNERIVRERLRAQHGMDIYARFSADQIRSLFSRHSLVVLEGMKSREEYAYLQTCFSHLVVVYLSADAPVRFRRTFGRRVRPLSHHDTAYRDAYERSLGSNALFRHADVVCDNNSTKAALYAQLTAVLHTYGDFA